MRAAVAILFICLDLVLSQGSPKRLQIASMTAKIGRDGTDDDVNIKICSDVDIADCCSAKLDKGVRKDEWVPSKTENWEAREFKECKNKPFKIRNGPLLSVTKNGGDHLKVNSIDFYMKTANQDQTRFNCEGFEFLNDCKKRPNGLCTYNFRQCQNCKLTKCDGKRTSGSKVPGKLPEVRPGRPPVVRPGSKTRPPKLPTTVPKDKKIDQMTVYVGPKGTDDNVRIKICSTDLSNCCVSDKLSHLLKSEWVKEKQEKWEAGKFGKCKNQVFKVSTFPRLFLIKDGKDRLSVRTLDFTMKNSLNEKEKTTYSCLGFDINDDCSKKPNKQCEKDLGSCLQKRATGSGPATRPPVNPRPRAPSTRPILQSKDQKIDKMVVNIGSDGTDDDVRIKICSDDNTVCCESDKLSHLLKSEWVKDKQETWEAKKFGSKCKKQIFKISSRPRLTFIKNGKDNLIVKSLNLIMKNPLNENEKVTYSCRGFSVTGDCSKNTNKVCSQPLGQCLSTSAPTQKPNPRPTKPTPRTTRRPPARVTKDQKIDKMVVNMGSDGTKDDVKVKICSDGNAVCCTSDKLSHFLSSEWVKDKQEIWESGKFGKCKKEVFKISAQPRVFLIKNGKDPLSVRSIDLVMKNPLNEKEKTTYSCNGLSIAEDCSSKSKSQKECVKDLGICRRSNGGGNGGGSNTVRPNIRATTSSPLKELKFEKMVVSMGADGTKDDVHVKLCSQDGTMCCDSGELSHFLSSEWVANKKETWDSGDFGKCKKQIFKVSTFPRVTIFKNKKDDMSVNGIDIVMKNAQNEKEKTTFSCSGFTLTGDCSKKECSKDLICFKK